MGDGVCRNRSVIVTGAGRGLGRAHALELARQGASVLVNDLGVDLDGGGGSSSPAEQVAAEIREAGGQAISNLDDVSDFAAAERLVAAAIDAFGHLDAVVNNAGFVRDRMFVNTTADEWDAVVRVHLRGHFSVARWASSHWRDRHKSGELVDARIVNTSSGAGLLGSVGQGGYSAAKAGIAALTLVQAAELGRYGVTANALAPSARTRMTEVAFADAMAAPEDPGAFDTMAPENVSPLVAWLCSSESRGVTGRVFEMEGGRITLMSGWHGAGTAARTNRWAADELGPVVAGLIAHAPAELPVYGSR